MSYLNSNIPLINCFVRGNFLRDNKDSHDKLFPVVIFGVSSIPHRPPLFHFLMEDGGMWWRMPIQAFCWKEGSKEQSLYDLVLWDSFSSYISVTQFDLLRDKSMTYLDRSGKENKGHYMMTFDWTVEGDILDVGCSQDPSQHKCGHLIKLDNGNFAIQPNNRVRLHEPSFVTQKDLVIKRLVNSRVWTAEDKDKWIIDRASAGEYEYTVEENHQENSHKEPLD